MWDCEQCGSKGNLTESVCPNCLKERYRKKTVTLEPQIEAPLKSTEVKKDK